MSAPTPARERAPRLPRVQALRALAALLVVGFHLATRSVDMLHRRFVGGVFDVSAIGVDIFFVLSGFIIFSVHRADIGKPAEARPYVIKRFIRVYPIYWLVTAIALAVYLTGYGDSYKRNPLVILKSLVLYPQPPGKFPVLNVGWTLTYEILFYALFLLWIWWPRKWALAVWVVWLIPNVVLAVGHAAGSISLVPQGVFDSYLIADRNLEFLLGCLAAWLLYRFTIPQPRVLMWAGLAVVIGFAIAEGTHLAFRPLHSTTLVIYGIPAAVMILGAAALDMRGARPPNSLLVKVGDASYSLYLIHFGLVTGAFALLREAGGENTPLLPLFGLVVAAGVSAIAYLVYIRIEAPMLQRLRTRFLPVKTRGVKAVVQRTTRACVRVDGDVVSAIDSRGLCVLVGVGRDDSAAKSPQLADKLWRLRIFDDDDGVMNLAAADIDAPLLLVSQFTLYGDTTRGRRPSWTLAAPAAEAEPIFDAVVDALRALGASVVTGVFGAHMEVDLVNDGPVTLVLDV